MRFSFPCSHAFANGRVIIDNSDNIDPDCLVEFADGVTVIAAWRRVKETIELAIPDYRTGKGTRVSARQWRLIQGPDGIWRTRRSS